LPGRRHSEFPENNRPPAFPDNRARPPENRARPERQHIPKARPELQHIPGRRSIPDERPNSARRSSPIHNVDNRSNPKHRSSQLPNRPPYPGMRGEDQRPIRRERGTRDQQHSPRGSVRSTSASTGQRSYSTTPSPRDARKPHTNFKPRPVPKINNNDNYNYSNATQFPPKPAPTKTIPNPRSSKPLVKSPKKKTAPERIYDDDGDDYDYSDEDKEQTQANEIKFPVEKFTEKDVLDRVAVLSGQNWNQPQSVNSIRYKLMNRWPNWFEDVEKHFHDTVLDLIYKEELDNLGVDEWHESKQVKLTKRRNVDIERLRDEDSKLEFLAGKKLLKGNWVFQDVKALADAYQKDGERDLNHLVGMYTAVRKIVNKTKLKSIRAIAGMDTSEFTSRGDEKDFAMLKAVHDKCVIADEILTALRDRPDKNFKHGMITAVDELLVYCRMFHNAGRTKNFYHEIPCNFLKPRIGELVKYRVRGQDSKCRQLSATEDHSGKRWLIQRVKIKSLADSMKRPPPRPCCINDCYPTAETCVLKV